MKGPFDPADIRQALLTYLQRERLAGALDLDELWSQPLASRIASGDALAGGRVLGWRSPNLLALHFAENTSRFRPWDLLRIGSGADPHRQPEMRLVEEDDGGTVLLQCLWGEDQRRIDPALPTGGRSVVLDRGEVDLSTFLGRAVEEVFRGTDAASRAVAQVLCGTFQLQVDPRQRERAEDSLRRLEARGLALESAQQEAYAAGWASRPVQLIQGPPGTGKTFLLALLAAALAWRGERLLITALTHRAVDNALLALARVAEPFGLELPLARLNPRPGQRWQLEQAGIRVLRGTRGALNQPGKREGQVIGATLFSAAGLEAGSFTRVIVDEAAQVPLSHAPCALRPACRWLLFGDDRQLGPVTLAEHGDLARRSLFEHLRPLAPPVMLDRTHRLNSAICSFPSQAFYGGRLEPTAAAARRTLPTRPGGRYDEVLAPDPAALVVPMDHEGYRSHCPPEADLAAALVEELLVHHELPAEEVAVISPFRRQNREILRRLRHRLGSEADLPVVDTVERIQGQEREAVIVSLACSDPGALRHDARFFFSPRRLCVSLTRARTKTIVLASPHLLDALPRSLEALLDFGLFCRLLAEWPRRRVVVPPPDPA
ncbi:MAG: AAA domain-containing protein [Acidobacteriota bacterium]|nr:AAA domain-containing protein [Acidobacteriota bacterium]